MEDKRADGTLARFLVSYGGHEHIPLTEESWTTGNRRVWEEALQAAMAWAAENLWGDEGAEARQWLHDERGLTDAAVKAAGLGWCPGDLYDDRERWGLPPEENAKGRPKRVWLPAGLVIPAYYGTRVRIRRPNPGDGPRYVTVTGSDPRPLALGVLRDRSALVVESDLDAWLCWQEAGDLAGAVALGSDRTKPEPLLHRLLTACPRVLVALDGDETGARAAWDFWPRTYRNAVRLPPVGDEDPCEMRRAGMDLREWVRYGLEDAPEARRVA